MKACATAERCITHFDQPDSAISCIHYERLIRVRLRIVVILFIFSVKWLLLVFYSGLTCSYFTPFRVMALVHSLAAPLVYPPDDLTLPQFILNDVHSHVTRPPRPAGTPCIIDEDSGMSVGFDEVRAT